MGDRAPGAPGADNAPATEDAPGAEGAASGVQRPAFYAARSGRWRDWWTLLHPPYTAWHLSYVVIGAALAPKVTLAPLLATLAAFFLAVGLAAHALDELHGRPLRTRIPGAVLIAVSVLGLAGAMAIGVAGVIRVGWPLIPFLLAGPLLVIAYNAELFGGIVHTDAGFAAAWGAFPLLTSYVAQTGAISAGSVLAATQHVHAARPFASAPAFAATSSRRIRPVGGAAEPQHPGAAAAPPGLRGHRQRHPRQRGRAVARRGPAAPAAGEGTAGDVMECGPARRRARNRPADLTGAALITGLPVIHNH